MSTQTEPPQALSYAEFRALPDDGKRYELWDGVLVEMFSPSTNHQRCVLRLARVLSDWADAVPGAEVMVAPLDLILRRERPALVLQPDVMLLLPGSHAQILPDGIEGGPDLAVEVLSPSTARRDRLHKLRRYAQTGVRSCWLVDPALQLVECLALRPDGSVAAIQGFADQDLLTDPLLPGFGYPLAELFAGFPPLDDQLP